MEENDKKQIKTAIIIICFSIVLLLVNKVISYEGGHKGKLEKQMYYIGAVYYEEGLFNEYSNDLETLKNKILKILFCFLTLTSLSACSLVKEEKKLKQETVRDNEDKEFVIPYIEETPIELSLYQNNNGN